MDKPTFDIDFSRGQAARINPVENIKTETDFVMTLLTQMANVPVSAEQLSLARKIALDEADKGPLTILRLVDAMDAHDELHEFSGALRKAALPGPYGQAFINPLA